ncbi:rhomboid family intramembrane serine protease [Dorea formicigenerans]|uniref:Rhomboid family intramembrane serine protease n=1 Tax=Dorea formicigenerans TaxID=39486 RepID=A0A3E4PYU5_9FIRM|nr:rhomboid family intramembrane serine protease [Dorea formicigenerans]RGK84965.1 rhomboid family intramembrane serine protease [Dorea formicigenerans]
MRNYKKLPICTIAIAAANVLIFLGLSFMGMTEDSTFMMEHGAMYVPYLMNGERYYTLITSMFLHFGFSHLMNNMVMLLVIGYSLEPEIGKIRFLFIYLGSGLMGNLVSAWFDVSQGSYAVSAGASGAIFGIVGALLYVAIRNHGRVGEISTRGLVLMAGLSLYYGFTAQGVDNAAHIGGLISGFLLAVLTYWKHKPKHY